MRIANFLCSLILITSAPAFSQVTLLPRVGISIAKLNINEKNSWETSPVTGTVAGLGLKISLRKAFSLQPEILFIRKGTVLYGVDLWTMEGYFSKHETTHTMKANYLEFPILANLTFGKKIKYFAGVGPFFGYALNGKVKTEDVFVLYKDDALLTSKIDHGLLDLSFDEAPGAEANRYEGTYIANRLDAGIQASAGMNVWKLSIDVRYSMGLTRIDTHEKIKHRGWQFSVALPLSVTRNITKL